MTNQPIVPTPKLIQQWGHEWNEEEEGDDSLLEYVATHAAQWGADQELEACCEWFQEFYKTESWVDLDLRTFRAARRPKPPSLKEQALALVEQHEDGWRPSPKDWDTIRRALEALPND
jgi:hypothetical protein